MINDFPLTDIERRKKKRNETTSEIAAMMLRKNELEDWGGSNFVGVSNQMRRSEGYGQT